MQQIKQNKTKIKKSATSTQEESSYKHDTKATVKKKKIKEIKSKHKTPTNIIINK